MEREQLRENMRTRKEVAVGDFMPFPYPEKGEPVENIALFERPSISIRTRLVMAFALSFAMCAAITIWSIYIAALVQEKIVFLETSGNYRIEIQQARRFEKNFLLYETNLPEAMEHLRNAEQILMENGETIGNILGASALAIMKAHAREYHSLLTELGRKRDPLERQDIEPKLREHGSQMISLALEFEREERESVRKMLSQARKIPFLFLAVLVVLMVFIAFFIKTQILGGLARFKKYTERIGRGNFTPIVPKRKYRDEFSMLAAAFNRMIQELDRRHNILVESHKLRAVGTLVAGVAHELNNPLNNTMLTATMLEEDFSTLDDKEKLSMVNDIIAETERSQKIVRNLLDFARESEMEIRPLQIEKILDDTIRLVVNQAKMAKVKIEKEFQGPLPPVHGDAQMLHQVFVNLILNAVDALPPHGTVRVSTFKTKEDGYVVVEVRDNGPGIPEHILPRIFDPFFTTKANGKGTGLGLSVSRGMVRKLGGYVLAESKAGEGTVFSVFLPATVVPSKYSSG
jgi:signal transduction histidine kinase